MLPDLIRATESCDERLVHAASLALGAFFDDGEAILAIVKLSHTADARLRHRATIDLSHKYHPAAKQRLAELLGDSDAGIRRSAVVNIAQWILCEQTDDVLEKVIPLVNDPDHDVRFAAIEAVGWSNSIRGLGVILDLFDQPSPNQRHTRAVELALQRIAFNEYRTMVPQPRASIVSRLEKLATKHPDRSVQYHAQQLLDARRSARGKTVLRGGFRVYEMATVAV